jgi:hypothetical protein
LRGRHILPVAMADRSTGRQTEPPVQHLLEAMTGHELRELVSAAAERHADVDRHVRLIAARTSGDLAQLRAEVDRSLRTRRFLDYRESAGWAMTARPVLSELTAAVKTSPTRALVELLERAVGHVVKVIMHADDSDGAIGDLAHELLTLHARACDAGVADPVKLAAWMIRFGFKDQDFFEPDPVRYAGALGDRGLAKYRAAVAQADDQSFAARYARERLAILDRDVTALVTLLGEDLTRPHQFVRVAEAMAELGLDDETLAWSTRGFDQTHGRQTDTLFDLACDVHTRRDQPLEVLALRRAQHERLPTATTYTAIRTAAEALNVWPLERDAARAALQRRNPPDFVTILLADGELDTAWSAATNAPPDAIGRQLWLRLAQAAEPDRPADALAVYQRLIDNALQHANRGAYHDAARLLKRARTTAQTAGQADAFAHYLARLRDQHRRRPSLIEILNKADLR